YVAAFEDRNGNQRYDPGEPVAHVSLSRSRTAYPALARFDLLLSEHLRLPEAYPRDVLARAEPHQSLARLDTVSDLDAPAFGADFGQQGLWQPMRFLREAQVGVHLLQPYDPDKTPVLFVHGAGGTPQDWRYFIEHLDRERFQPWVYYYPSGL